MTVAVITGSLGLVGSEAATHFAESGYDVVGIDNDLRGYFFGPEGSTKWNRARLDRELGAKYTHLDADVRDAAAIEELFRSHGAAIGLVVHAAAQPSHDWAAREPATDFSVNAQGTLNLLEAARQHCPDVPFVFMSTNKVYGDRPNTLPLVEEATRWEVDPAHPYAAEGIPEEMSIDASLHSLFGASKVAADVLVQEYGRYFGMRTACLRAGCITGPRHSGAQLHGFLAYLMKCAALGRPYTVYGYKGKQVRDNIHAADLVAAIDLIARDPKPGEVYNIGGGRDSNCSMVEAITLAEEIAGRPMEWTYTDDARIGDHIWYVSDLRRLREHYPAWGIVRDVPAIMKEIYDQNVERWRAEK
ncbi:MAG: NAD-dependent epimerase/dehydratase family protein [Actinomycetota bacterium]